MRRRVILIGTILGIAAVAVAIWFFLPSRIFISTTAAAASTCDRCHGDMDRLGQLSEQPETYYVDPVQFAQETHSGLACTTCHSGDPTKDTPEEACLNGKAYKDPSAIAVVDKTCGTCHREITGRFKTSIHATLSGIRTSLVDFLGEKDATAKFNDECNQCHTTCSNCHMETPDDRKILWANVTNHHFVAHADSKVCAACHGDTGVTFLGEPDDPKHPASLMAQAGMQCADCHKDEAVHGNGKQVTFLAQMPMPECQQCHNQPVPRVTSAKDTLVAPQYNPDTPAHKMHANATMSCAACHTEWYNSCWTCHNGREAKSVDTLFLGVNPQTKLIYPLVHSPATTGEGGTVPDSVGGGWAVKSRHSWGASQACETCHTNPDTYVTVQDRQAPFLGFWGSTRMKALFVDQKVVQQLIIDDDQLKQSAHRDQTCDDCHQVLTDRGCTPCHDKTAKTGKTVLPAEADWSRKDWIAVQADLDQSATLMRQVQSAGANTADWQRQWNALKENYLQVANNFHAQPGQAQTQVKEIGTQSQALLRTVQQTAQAQEFQNRVLPVGALFASGTLGALVLGLVLHRGQRNRKHV